METEFKIQINAPKWIISKNEVFKVGKIPECITGNKGYAVIMEVQDFEVRSPPECKVRDSLDPITRQV